MQELFPISIFMQRRTSKHRAFDPDPDAPAQCCDHPDCEQPAGYRAPRGRDNLRSYYWFCLEHIRTYNAKWDYYRGMTPGQIETHLRADTSWQRPSWKLGNIGATRPNLTIDGLHDPMDILRGQTAHPTRKKTPSAHYVPEILRAPLATLNMDWPTSLEDVKTRYRTLTRRYHPDANPGDKKAEEHFKSISSAYTTLRAYFTTEHKDHDYPPFSG